jgi:predicted O-linked N-acetylglucosamine transferase (SPINDLY family)/SAM-dependent methyltransferase
MTNPAARLQALIEQVNSGAAAEALPEIERWLAQHPDNPALLAVKAEALRLGGRGAEAIPVYQRAAEKGGGARNWWVAGALLAGERKIDEALKCLLNASTEAPDDEQILDTLITTLFNSNRGKEAVGYARRQLASAKNPRFLANAALLLQSNDAYEEASEAFKRIVQLAPEDPTLIGSALSTARFTCEWEWIESLQRQITAWHEAGEFGAPQEYPLTHLTWCPDEARNLAVTRAYAERVIPAVEPCTPRTDVSPGKRIRVGYLSCDFRNHATMHLMAGVFEHHDRERFEVFAYDYSAHDISDYRQRFLDAIEHHVPVDSLSEKEAAARIAADNLDILFDLKVYTGGCRPTILAYRPAPLQAAYIGFPGSAANPYIDFIVSDRFVTPDSSTPWYTEKFCRLPHSYQCNDRKRLTASEPGTRALHGLPDDKVIFGAFNQSYKIDRESFDVWLRILAEVPDSVLWLLGQTQSAITNLSRHAQAAGLAPDRLIFAPFAEPRLHLARLQLADAVLDTLVCNGHTTTSDALWAGVPVITAKGKHFASRVSESLLNAMDLPELVGADYDDMVRIAKRIGTDASYRAALRDKTRNNRLTAPLFDTARFTRDFETGIEMMVEQNRSGAARAHIDVPDRGPVEPRPDVASSTSETTASLQTPYPACPLCQGTSVTLGFANCTTHPLWHEPLPRMIEWMRCPSCGHVHNRSYWNEAGLAQLLVNSHPAGGAAAADIDAKRATWAPVVDKVIGALGGYAAVVNRDTRPVWVDVGCGEGGLVMTAADCGFAAVGLDRRAEAVSQIKALGFTALQHDFMTLRFEVVVDVLSLMDSLQQMPFPREALRKAAQVLHPGGVLVISAPDLTSSSWKAMSDASLNPYWTELEHLHHFSRDQLIALLREHEFEIVGFAIPNRHKAQMEIYAVRKASR